MQMGPALLPTPLSPARGLHKKDLATGVSPFPGQAPDPVSAPALAPASGSFRFCFQSEDCLLSLPVPRPFIPCWPGSSSGSALAEAPAFPSLPGRSVRPVSAILSRSDHWTAQRLVETFCEASYWTAWTVAKTSVRVKISSDIKSLDRQSEKVFRLSDDLRLRFKAESGKQVIH